MFEKQKSPPLEIQREGMLLRETAELLKEKRAAEAEAGRQICINTELEQQLAELLKALLIGGRESAEIEFGADHEHIARLAHGTWAGWLEKARQELLQESSDE